VLDGGSARKLVEAREKAFWTAKAAGADDVIDVVVPRSEMPGFLARVRELATAAEAGAVGCGHAGDGNVHLGIFCKDPQRRHKLLHDIFAAGVAAGGAISGEHGIGEAKKDHFLALEDPAKIALLRRIKQAFDPLDILNPGVLFD
jgi:glycolate dehydrogenase FAD-linked subunit